MSIARNTGGSGLEIDKVGPDERSPCLYCASHAVGNCPTGVTDNVVPVVYTLQRDVD